MYKRGVSKIVTIVLIILVSIVAIFLLWNGVKVFLNNDFSHEELKVYLSLEKFNYVDGGKVKVIVGRTPGGADVAGYKVVFTDENGENFVESFEGNINPLEKQVKIINLEGFNAVSAQVFPYFIDSSSGEEKVSRIGSDKLFTSSVSSGGSSGGSNDIPGGTGGDGTGGDGDGETGTSSLILRPVTFYPDNSNWVCQGDIAYCDAPERIDLSAYAGVVDDEVLSSEIPDLTGDYLNPILNSQAGLIYPSSSSGASSLILNFYLGQANPCPGDSIMTASLSLPSISIVSEDFLMINGVGSWHSLELVGPFSEEQLTDIRTTFILYSQSCPVMIYASYVEVVQ